MFGLFERIIIFFPMLTWKCSYLESVSDFVSQKILIYDFPVQTQTLPCSANVTDGRKYHKMKVNWPTYVMWLHNVMLAWPWRVVRQLQQ